MDFTIKDLENISGIKAHTIRIWEKRYGLFQPKRTNTNIRYYSQKSLQKLLNVVLLNKHNYKISKIASMSEEQIALTAKELSLSLASYDKAFNMLKSAVFQFDKTLFNKAYNNLLIKKTFRETFKEVFVPFIKHIGMLWQTNTITLAHEHFISNLIIQKIQTNTDKIESLTSQATKRTYVLFLPEGEIHQIGLLYLNYELTLRGGQTIYLGNRLSISTISYLTNTKKAVNFVCSLTLMPNKERIIAYFKQINKILKGTNHQLVGIGDKALTLELEELEFNFKSYPSVFSYLQQF
ncbi:MAG: MerR family transcriptional regulator [Tenacibaculum sp.]